MRLMLLVALLGGCAKDPGDTGKGGENGTGENGTGENGTGENGTGENGGVDSDTNCETAVISMEPTDGAAGIYYRDPLTVSFSDDGSAAVISVLDSAGAAVGTTVEWSDGNVQAFVTADLAASTTYTLSVAICDQTTEVSFSTSELGTPLQMTNEELIGRTYYFRLSNDATITEPAFLDIMADSYLTVPLLFGVMDATEIAIDWLGALGTQNNDGTYSQQTSQLTWDFPYADFMTAPYFYTESPLVTLTYNSIDIPIEQFTLEGTFTADASEIQKARATGYADTRNLGTLVNLGDDPNAICMIAESAGAYCTDCSDGEPYCLYIVGEEITAHYAEGLTLEEVLE